MGWLSGLASAALGIGSSLYQNNQNKKAQERANRHNIELAQMNNEFNERMLQKQMDYNTEMWNKQNEYNSASAQVQRYKEAGLNPTMMMQGQSAGIAQSANGVNTPSAQPVQVQPERYDFSRVADSIQYMLDYRLADQKNQADTKLINEQAKGVQIENQYKLAEAYARIYDLTNSGNLKGAQKVKQMIENQYIGGMMESQINLNKQSASYQAQAAGNMAMTALLNYKEIKRFDKKSQLELANLAAQIAESKARKGYITTQEQHEWLKALDTMRTAEGKKIDNHLKEETFGFLIHKAANDAAPTIKTIGGYVANWFGSELSKKRTYSDWYSNTDSYKRKYEKNR